MNPFAPGLKKTFVYSRPGASLGITMVTMAGLSVMVLGVLRLATFNAQTVTTTESITEHSKAAASLLEFSAAQLAAKLSSMRDFSVESPAHIARNFRFLPASQIFVGNRTAIGLGQVNLDNDANYGGPATFCEVCRWPDAPKTVMTTTGNKAVTVDITAGPADLLNAPLNISSSDYNKKDPCVGASYSNSAYIPLRCRIAGFTDSKGNTHDVYATAVLWMREANLFRHALYLNEILYYMGTGGTETWEGSIFSNKPMIFNLSAGNSDNPVNSSATGFYQFERVACPQFFVCAPGTYLGYAASGGWNSSLGTFNAPDTTKLADKINYDTRAAWMGRGDLNGDGFWNAFKQGTTTLSALNPLNSISTESRPLYLTLADLGDYSDPENFWKPATGLLRANGGTNSRGYITLDSSNPDYLRTYASKFNGAFVTNESGFTASLPDGIPPTAAPLARVLIEPASPSTPGMPELPRPDGKTDPSLPLDPTYRKYNPSLYDQWAAYLAIAGTSNGYNASAQDLQTAENLKYANKAGIYVYVDTEGTVTAFTSGRFDTPAKAAADYKAATDKAAWINSNKSSVISLPSDVISTTNVFLDDTEINRSYKNGTSYNGAPGKSINSTNNGVNTSNGDVTTIMDQARLVRAIDINFGALRSALRTSGAITKSSGGNWNPASSWTGSMYVDVANPVASTTPTSTWGQSLERIKTSVAYTTTDATTGSTVSNTGKTYSGANLDTAFNAVMHQTAVRIYNATQIPDMVGVSGIETTPGFTLATNAAAYSVGSVNADTDPNTYPKNSTLGKTENNDIKTSADAVVPTSSSYHIPFGLVCDNYTTISPAYQGNLNSGSIAHTSEGYTIPAKAISLDATQNNLTSITNVADAKGLAFGDLATLFNIKLNSSNQFTPSTNTPKNAAQTGNLFDKASLIELNIALITGGGDAQTSTSLHGEPLHIFNLDNNASTTMLYFNGSQVGLFKSQYRPKYNRDALTTCYPKQNSTRYDPNFAKGYVPPGALFTRSYRLTGFRIISKAEFDRMKL